MANYDLVNSLKKNYEIFSMADDYPTSLPLEPEPLAERPLDIVDSMSGITCTSATQEAISEGVARSPRRPERSLSRTPIGTFYNLPIQ